MTEHDEGTPWSRVHWSTPYLRSWSAFVLGGFVLVQNVGEGAVRSLVRGDRPEGPGLDGGVPVAPVVLLAVLGGVLALALLVAGLGVVSWRATRFRVTPQALELHHGVVFRSQKAARLDRIQAVDVVRPLLARLLGLAQLKVEVAGGGDSKFVLQFLRVPVAREVRARVLAGATASAEARLAVAARATPPVDDAAAAVIGGAGVVDPAVDMPVPPAPGATAAEDPQAHLPRFLRDDETWPGESLVEVPLVRLLASLALSPALVGLIVALIGLVVTAAVTDSVAPLAFVVPWVLGWAGSLWKRFTHGYGFRLATGVQGVRLRHGLLELKTQTVPPGRVQAVRVSQPLLWRGPDWWRVEVNVAGYGAGGGEDPQTVLLPVGTRAEAVTVVGLVVGDLGEGERSGQVIDAALTGVADVASPDGAPGTEGSFLVAPRRARRVDPFGYRRIGVRVAADALVARGGRWRRHAVVVPHARTQSLAVEQGPLQRRMRLATVVLHSTPGPVAPEVAHLDERDAAALAQAQAARARQARSQGRQ
ncbi:MAG: PH domain-containing protein [Kineosporiaceae bacterium]